MAMGKPVIATRISDLPLILEGCGELVPPADASALARAIQSVLDDPQQAVRLGQAARARCLALYSREVTCRQLRHLFCGLLSGMDCATVHAP
jgi:glycosyltransferase involved in cell wall biosynthesis